MPAESPLPNNHPLVKAFEAYKQTDEYINARRWAANDLYVDGSLWAAFAHGWYQAKEEQKSFGE